MGITLTGKPTLTGPLKLRIDSVNPPDPFANDVVFLATFEDNFNNQVGNYDAPYDTMAVTRLAGSGYNGSYSANFPGGAYCWLTYSPDASYTAINNTVPFTLEMYVNYSAGGNLFSNSAWQSGGPGIGGFGLNTGSLVSYFGSGGSQYNTYTLSANEWHHLAVTYAGDNGNINLFVDGTYTVSVAPWINPSQPRWQFGSIYGQVNSAVCQMDKLRITKAVRYTGNFTPFNY